MKIYIEIEGGLVNGVYTDDKETDINVILCDHDDAEYETEYNCREFVATKNCNELEQNRNNLRSIY